MGELEKKACFDGRAFRLEGVVGHVSGDGAVVLCRAEGGELRFATVEEWGVAAGRASDAAPAAAAGAANVQAATAAGDAPVTQRSTLDEKVSLVMSLFRGRADVYAEAFEGRTTKPGKLSYWPPCRLRWERGACPRVANPKARCRECDHPSYVPLTHEVVRAHCLGRRDGRGRIQAVGIYVVDEGDVCYLLAADFDGPGWQDSAAAYRDACRAHGLSPAVERSRSGNGAHVWVFFDGAVRASLARRVGEGLVSEAQGACAAVSFRSFDRLFPLQDSVGAGELGSLIALPLQGEAVRQGNSVFVDDRFEALPDQCAYLSMLPKASPDRIAALADEFGKDPVGLPAATSRRLSAPKSAAEGPGKSGPRTREDMPSEVRVTLSDGVRVTLDGVPPRVLNRLRRLAAFRNPEYTKKLRMHFSVWDTPRLVDLSRADGDELVLPRGCADAVLAALRDVGTKPVLSDERTEGEHIHARFLGRLRAIQGPCADKLAKHDLGVLVAPTGFGKSVIAASVIATHQVSTLVIVPNTALLAQWRESLAKFLQIDDDPPVLLTKTGRRSKHQPGVVGLIGGGKCLRSGIVDVALAGSLFEKGEVAGETVVSPYVAEYGMVIVDEAQHVAASKVLEVLGRVRARYVYGMTATPKRDDGLDRILFLECGPLRHEVAVADQMAEQGMRRLLVPRFCASRPELEGRPTWNMLIDYIGSNEERNHLIATDVARALRKGRVALVLTRRVEHARTIAGDIEQLAEPLGVPVILLVGSDDDSTKRSRLDSLRAASADRPLCVVATGPYVGEGFDLDRLDTLFLAEPVAFEGTATQWVGRLHRVHEGKSNVIVMDYVDTAIPMFDREWRGRMKAYEKLGYQTAGTGDLGLVGLSEDSTPLGHLFAGKEYCKALEKDLADCSSRVVMISSWMRLARVKVLRELIEGAGKRGVAVGVVLKEPAKPSSEWRQAVSVLREAGCDVRMTKGGASSDCVVLDGGLVWFGSVAPLAFPRRGDCALRLVNREVAASLLETFDMGEG